MTTSPKSLIHLKITHNIVVTWITRRKVLKCLTFIELIAVLERYPVLKPIAKS